MGAEVEMPESFSGGWVEGEEIAAIVGGEKEMAGGGEDSGDAFSVAEFVIPDKLSGFVIERPNCGVGPEIPVAAAPAFGFGFDGVVINAEEAARVDVKEIGLWIEARGHPVGCAVGAGRNESAVGAGSSFGFCRGAALRVDTG